LRSSKHTNPPNSKSEIGPFNMVRKKKLDIDHEFFEELANNTPNDSQFKTKKKISKKKYKMKPVTKEPDTGWSGIV